MQNLEKIFNDRALAGLMPENLADQFFEALYGDAEEGAYDIFLSFEGYSRGKLEFIINLKQRPGKCMACSLTYGLPHVFARHPIINLKGLIEKIDGLLDGNARCVDWKLGETQSISRELHVIRLTVFLDEG